VTARSLEEPDTHQVSSILVRRQAPGSARLSKAEVRSLAACMLDALGLGESELSILLTNDRLIREINRDHRGKDKPTDVLSFPQSEFSAPLRPKRGFRLDVLGDVVISIDTAERAALSRRRSLREEVRFLLAHGILHLVGYDHATPAEKEVMTKRTKELVRKAPLAP
jgi:probable rRNA maturation factor